MWNDVLRIVICAGVGALTGLVWKKVAPTKCGAFAKWSLDSRRLPMLLIAAMFFLVCSIVNFANGSIVHGFVGVALVMLELVAIVVIRCRKTQPNV